LAFRLRKLEVPMGDGCADRSNCHLQCGFANAFVLVRDGDDATPSRRIMSDVAEMCVVARASLQKYSQHGDRFITAKPGNTIEIATQLRELV
jgi:hypothetical protein